MDFLKAISEKVLIVDGAMGSRLSQLGFETAPYCAANITSPDLVSQVHREYLDAGADAIETNTFWANRFRLAAVGSDLDPYEICLKGAHIARAAAGDKFVLGAIGPCGKPLAPLGIIDLEDAKKDFLSQAKALIEGGVDAIILETISDMAEMEIAIRAIRQATDIPLIACKSFIEDGETLAEGFPYRAAKQMLEWGADCVGANCVVGPQRMFEIVRWMAEVSDAKIVAMPTPGMPQLVRGAYVYDIKPEYFGKAAARLVEAGANMIGGCCGALPTHIASINGELRDRTPRKRKSAHIGETATKLPLPESDPSEFSKKIGKEFVFSVELDLPRGLDTSKVLNGASELKQAGCNLIDISDGARARLRMTPSAIATIIQRDVGIEVMMHVACRDRNLLAIQADLLGSHALGIRNVLAVTGDPANIGDFPSATSVFDIDSIGLVRVLSRFNEGRDLAGNSVGRKCAFTIAIALNPMAQNLDWELDRLKRKADAGAQVIFTQPVFETPQAEIACEMARKAELPILIGVMPLRSKRHAEFMHNEVPGIEVPTWLREKFNEVEDAPAAEMGIEIACEFATKLPLIANGAYIMPPFGNHQVAMRVIEATKAAIKN